MLSRGNPRLQRAIVLGGLAALFFFTHVFVDSDRVRIKVVQTPIAAAEGMARASTAGFPDATELSPPFALIARFANESAAPIRLAITVDGTPVCDREVSANSTQRFDCVIAGPTWDPVIDHSVTIEGPQTAWALQYLELATHHGNTDGWHDVLILPELSNRYTAPSPRLAAVVWILIAGVVFLPAHRMRRGLRVLHLVLSVGILLEVALILATTSLSDFRIVMSSRTFALFAIILCAPRVWTAVRSTALWTKSSGALRWAAQPRVWVGALVVIVSGALGWQFLQSRARAREAITKREIRQALLNELRPVTLENCTLKRYGLPNDGGYLMCDNLIEGAESAYSYGIAGEDKWGCDLSQKISVPIHQYDCFDLTRPVCPGARFVFHGQCIAGEPLFEQPRHFNTLANQVVRNGDAGKRLIVKLDVEGAEWESLLATPDSVLDQIDQLPMELHGTDDARFVKTLQKLKRIFHLVHVHYNNMGCGAEVAPLPSRAFQVLLVNKRIGIEDVSAPPPTLPHPDDARDNPDVPDCQPGSPDASR
jgi:hypothetical protein